MKKVSVIIPFFNRKDFLEEAINSVLSQSFQDWELLLIDDGSTDGATEIAQAYALKDERISFFRRPENMPKGAPSCRNIGIDNAKGKYVLFLDSDDLLLPFCLEQRIKATEKFPGFDGWIFQMVKLENEQITYTDTENLENLEKWNTLKTDPLIQFLNIDSPWHTSGGLWTTDVLRQKNIRFDSNLAVWQDVDFHIQILTANLNLKILLDTFKPDIIYRIHGHTISQKAYPPHYRKSQIYFFDKWLQNLSPAYSRILKLSFERYFNTLLSKKDLTTLLTLFRLKSNILNPGRKLRILLHIFPAFFKKLSAKF